jgi:hypothetical protein
MRGNAINGIIATGAIGRVSVNHKDNIKIAIESTVLGCSSRYNGLMK